MRPVGPYMKVVLTGCSTYIYIGVELRATLSDLMIYAVSVPTEHLDTFSAKLHESLSRIAKDGVDQNRMRMVIDRDERQVFFRFMAPFQPFLIVFQVSQQSRIQWRRCILTDHDCRLSLWAFGWLSDRGSLE